MKVKVKLLCRVRLFATPWTVTHQAPLSMGFSKPGFSNMRSVNFQMFKLVSEKANELEIKLSTSAGSSKKQESSKKVKVKLKSLNHV